MPEPTTLDTPTTQNQSLLFLKHTGWLLLAGVPATLFLFFGQYAMIYWIPLVISMLIIGSTYIWYFWCIGQSYHIYTNLKLFPKIISTLLSVISLFLLIALSLGYWISGSIIDRYELFKKCDNFEILTTQIRIFTGNNCYFIYKGNSIRKIKEMFDKSKEIHPDEKNVIIALWLGIFQQS